MKTPDCKTEALREAAANPAEGGTKLHDSKAPTPLFNQLPEPEVWPDPPEIQEEPIEVRRFWQHYAAEYQNAQAKLVEIEATFRSEKPTGERKQILNREQNELLRHISEIEWRLSSLVTQTSSQKEEILP